VCPHINGKLESSDRTLAEDPPPVRPESPASVPDLSIHLRYYSEATEARFTSNADCGRRELRNTGAGVIVARAPPDWGRHSIAEFLVRSEGGDFVCVFKDQLCRHSGFSAYQT